MSDWKIEALTTEAATVGEAMARELEAVNELQGDLDARRYEYDRLAFRLSEIHKEIRALRASWDAAAAS